MRWRVFLLAMVLLGAWTGRALAAEARVKKVLVHLLDRQGRHTLHPSLYDRDVYQAYLRKHPAEQGGLRFDVEWTAPQREGLLLRIELRSLHTRGTSKPEEIFKSMSLEAPVHRHGFFGCWSSLTLSEEQYKEFGDANAWRASLWEDGHLLAEQKSFLW